MPGLIQSAAILGCQALKSIEADWFGNGLCYSDQRWLVGVFVWLTMASLIVILVRLGERRLQPILHVVCVLIAAAPLTLLVSIHLDGQEHQKHVLSRLNQHFPRPVPDNDAGENVAGIPLVISKTLGVGREPIMERAEAERLGPKSGLMPHESYLREQQWRDLEAGESRSFLIVLPGNYTLLASGPVIIDRQQYAPGETVSLSIGPHELQTTTAEPYLRIRAEPSAERASTPEA